jgi:hypothetical protein
MPHKRARIVITATILSPSKGLWRLTFVILKTMIADATTVKIMVNIFILC